MARRRTPSSPNRASERQSLRFSEALVRTAEAIARADGSTIEAELDRSLERLGSALGADITSIAGVEPGGRLEAWLQWRGIGWMDPAFSMDSPTAEWWDTRQRRHDEIIIDDVCSMPDDADYERALLTERGTQSLVAAPITSITELYGYVVVEHIEHRHYWTSPELEFIAGYADLAAAALERRQVQRDLEDRAKRAEAASQLKTQFVANLSHELRTPLSAILGYADLLGKLLAGPLNDKQQEYVAEIDRSAAHLEEIVEDALDIASVDAGRARMSVQELSLEATIDSAIAQVETRARERRVTVRTDVTLAEHTVYADGRKLRQILINLLVNAIKFNREGGEVTLRARVDHSTCVIEVGDTGVGIHERDLERIFESFVHDTDCHDSAGLGLTLVQRLAEAHGGTVTVRSEVGVGSTFRVELPRDARPYAVNRVPYLGGLT